MLPKQTQSTAGVFLFIYIFTAVTAGDMKPLTTAHVHTHTHTIKDWVAQLYLDTSPDWSLPSSPFTAPGSAFTYCS